MITIKPSEVQPGDILSNIFMCTEPVETVETWHIIRNGVDTGRIGVKITDTEGGVFNTSDEYPVEIIRV